MVRGSCNPQEQKKLCHEFCWRSTVIATTMTACCIETSHKTDELTASLYEASRRTLLQHAKIVRSGRAQG